MYWWETNASGYADGEATLKSELVDMKWAQEFASSHLMLSDPGCHPGQCFREVGPK